MPDQSNLPTPENREVNVLKSRPFLSGLVALVVLGVILFGWYIYSGHLEKKKRLLDAEAQQKVTTGLEAIRNDEGAQAIGILQEAVASAQNTDTRALSEFNLGTALHVAGRKIEAVAKLKEVANNEEVSPYIRAKAIEYMARMFFLTHDGEVFRAIFTGKPYDDFEIDGAKDISIRNLLEYGESLYPMGLAQLKIARLYGEEMIEKKSKDPTTIALIKSYIDKAEPELATPDPVLHRNLVSRKAMAVGWLYELGDDSYGDPEKYYREIMELEHTKQHSKLSGAGEKIRYAMFLVRVYRSTRSADIKTLIQEGVNSPGFKESNIYQIINNERGELLKVAPANSGAYDIALAESNPALSFDAKTLLLVAKIDPFFKKALSDLGWNIK